MKKLFLVSLLISIGSSAYCADYCGKVQSISTPYGTDLKIIFVDGTIKTPFEIAGSEDRGLGILTSAMAGNLTVCVSDMTTLLSRTWYSLGSITK